MRGSPSFQKPRARAALLAQALNVELSAGKGAMSTPSQYASSTPFQLCHRLVRRAPAERKRAVRASNDCYVRRGTCFRFESLLALPSSAFMRNSSTYISLVIQSAYLGFAHISTCCMLVHWRVPRLGPPRRRTAGRTVHLRFARLGVAQFSSSNVRLNEGTKVRKKYWSAGSSSSSSSFLITASACLNSSLPAFASSMHLR